MKTAKYIIPACVLLMAGCTFEQAGNMSEPVHKEIRLGVEGLGGGKAETRAPLDKWEDTEVSIAYAYSAVTPYVFNKALTVNVSDNNDERINTGMEYSADDSEVSFIGYYPVTAPNESGYVYYDISRGDVDVMMSNRLTGKESNRIIDQAVNALTFEHQLTRFTFLMKCVEGASYPEPVNGVRFSDKTGATSDNRLMTYVMLDLGADVPVPAFTVPGSVFFGSAEPKPVPQDHGGWTDDKYLVYDVMVQPNVPVHIEVITVSDAKTITVDGSSAALWTALTDTQGGEAGKRYTIKLEFSGEGVMENGITVTDWKTGVSPTGSTTWW